MWHTRPDNLAGLMFNEYKGRVAQNKIISPRPRLNFKYLLLKPSDFQANQ